MKCIFTIDVEDWFHILDLPTTPRLQEWDSLPSRVEKNFLKLLDILAEKDVRATCFFLGWVAERFPHLVQEADRRGHEIASHGYAHRLVYQMTPREFRDDAEKSKAILESIVGRPILGYRSAGFSATDKTPWFFEQLSRAQYKYDSSVFPAPRGHGGMKNGRCAPYVVQNGVHRLYEIPITLTNVLGRPICFFGGGYLRLFPYAIIRQVTLKVLREGRPVIFYIHPREVDPDHPRLPMGIMRRFKSYVNLGTTEAKLEQLISEFQYTTCCEYLKDHSHQLGIPATNEESVDD